MKKIKLFLIGLLMIFSFSACTDEFIADTLEGTWSGNMYVSSYYNGYDYYATRTELTFIKDPFRFTSGYGYWIDYYSNAPWDYVANHIDWEVDNSRIYIYFNEENTSIAISDYYLSDSKFYGTIIDGNNKVDFNLIHISSPNWDNYTYWGYDSWYYYSRSNNNKPIRQFGKINYER